MEASTIACKLNQPVLLNLFQLVGIDHIGRSLVFAGGLVVASSDFVFFVAGKAVFLNVLIAQLIFGAAFGVFARYVGRMVDFTHGVAGLRVFFKRGFGHTLDVFKSFAVAAVGKDFLVNVSGHLERMKSEW